MSTKCSQIWDNLEEYICCFLLALIVVLLMAQVLCRYVGGRSLSWSEEICRFAFLYLVYFAASLATHKNVHVRVTAQLKLLPRKAQMVLLLLTDMIWLAFCLIVLYVGTVYLIEMADRPMVSGALMLDMRYVYLSIPLAFCLQSIRLIERWWKIFTGRAPLIVPSEEAF